jgi:SPP1 gp7 family putative phage head morphogenesis protein
MGRIYTAALSRLVRELAALDERLAAREAEGKPLAEAALAMRDRLEVLIDQTEEQLKQAASEATRITMEGQQTALVFTNDQTGALVFAATGDPKAASVAIDWAQLSTDELEAFAGLSSNGSPLATLFDSITQDTPGALRLILGSGMAQGKNPRALVREMVGVAGLTRRRAETIARTEMIRASREAQRRMYEASPAVKGYRRLATQDGRTCLACLVLSGTVHKTAEIMPSHPNCRCVMIPITPSLAEITGDPSIPDLRPKAIGPEEIMSGLTDLELLGILGPRRLRLYRDGTPLADMIEVLDNPQWGPTTRIKPIKEIVG